MALEAGKRIGRAVELTRPLGVGNMGSVWVARHRALDADVAVKFIARHLVDEDEAFIARFQREASVAANIKSPHVVRTFDYGVIDGTLPYIVMELLEGRSLGNLLDSGHKLSLDQTAQVVRQTCRALRIAHKLGVVHRDIKPDNLFLVHLEGEDELFVKVLDFGIAKQRYGADESLLTAPGSMAGTPAYMSPEQVMSATELDGRADLWSLSVIAYECVTGLNPWTGETLGQLFRNIDKAEFQLPSQVLGRPMPAFDAFCQRALTRDIEGRYQTAAELTAAMDAAAQVTGRSLSVVSNPGDGALHTAAAEAFATQGARDPAKDTAVPITGAVKSSGGRGPLAALALLAAAGLGGAGVWLSTSQAPPDTAEPATTAAPTPTPSAAPSAEPQATASAAPTATPSAAPVASASASTASGAAPAAPPKLVPYPRRPAAPPPPAAAPAPPAPPPPAPAKDPFMMDER